MVLSSTRDAVQVEAMICRSALYRALLHVLSALALACLPCAAAAETSASYTLEARLPDDGSVSSVRGKGTIELRNGSARALESLSFHLYMNAYKPHSLAMNSGGQGGRASMRGGGFGEIEVHALRDLRTNAPLMLELPPADADQTTARVTLPEPLQPGETISLAISWTTSFPRLVQRSGYVRNYLFAGQWFPKLAKLEPDGTFAQFPFHPLAEFYSNFGRYDVTIDAPEQFVIATAGVQMDVNHHQGRQRRRFVVDRIHDYAWSAWPDYQMQVASIGSTSIRLFTPPGHDANARVTLETLQRILPFFQEWLGPYPYETLTVVHPPVFAANAGGMEYPTLVTTGGAWYAAYLSNDVQRVVVHELAHQWFYGLLASNEHAWPFLDEGLTTFAENRAMQLLLDTHIERQSHSATLAAQRYRALEAGHDFAIAAPAPHFPSFSHLASLAYERAAVVFDTLSRVYGESFMRALQAYATEHRFAHPAPEQLMAAIAEHVSISAAELTHAALFDRAWVNYKLSSISHDYSAQRVATASAAANVVPSGNIASHLLVTRQGSLGFPVQIEFHDAAGRHYVRDWNGQSDTWEFTHVGSTAVVRACVDPERTVTIDERYIDNCLHTEPQRRPWLRGLLASLTQLLQVAAAW